MSLNIYEIGDHWINIYSYLYYTEYYFVLGLVSKFFNSLIKKNLCLVYHVRLRLNKSNIMLHFLENKVIRNISVDNLLLSKYKIDKIVNLNINGFLSFSSCDLKDVKINVPKKCRRLKIGNLCKNFNMDNILLSTSLTSIIINQKYNYTKAHFKLFWRLNIKLIYL